MAHPHPTLESCSPWQQLSLLLAVPSGIYLCISEYSVCHCSLICLPGVDTLYGLPLLNDMVLD